MLLFGKHINKYYLKYMLPLILGVLALLFVDWIQLYLPEYVGQIVKILTENNGEEEIPMIVGKIMIVGFGMFFGRMAWRYTLFFASHKMAHEMRKEMFEKAENLSRDFYHKNKNSIDFILDAKYKHLNRGIGREDLYQVVTYMYCSTANHGGYVYPDDGLNSYGKYQLTGHEGYIHLLPVSIPQSQPNHSTFLQAMKLSEEELKSLIQEVK